MSQADTAEDRIAFHTVDHWNTYSRGMLKEPGNLSQICMIPKAWIRVLRAMETVLRWNERYSDLFDLLNRRQDMLERMSKFCDMQPVRGLGETEHVFKAYQTVIATGGVVESPSQRDFDTLPAGS